MRLKWIDSPFPHIVNSSLAGIRTDAVSIGTELGGKTEKQREMAE